MMPQNAAARPEGWFVNPSDRSVSVPARWRARQKVRAYRTHAEQLAAKQDLRLRMSMIVTIDRAGTSRSIESESVG